MRNGNYDKYDFITTLFAFRVSKRQITLTLYVELSLEDVGKMCNYTVVQR